ncbi:MAG: site-specific integrase [Planctomycetota bacterium]
MPRQPKPFFRKQTKSWYFSTGGKQFNLGKNKERAFVKFHEMMADSLTIVSDSATLYELTQVYLDWVESNRKPATYDRNRHYLESFIDNVGRRLKVSALKRFHLTKWTDNDAWGSTSRNDAIGVVQRMLNWSVEEGYLVRNPIAGMKKPRRSRRDVFYNADQWAQIKAHARPPLDDFLDFLYTTGCRPQEARTLEAKHIHEDLVIFPADESKGEREPRVIYLVQQAKAIIHRLMEKHPNGTLFRNSKGNPWTKDAIKCRLSRIGEKVGFRVIAYGARHSFATDALAVGGVDPISVAHLMGHKDPSMVAKVYSHVAKNPDFLRKQAARSLEGKST